MSSSFFNAMDVVQFVAALFVFVIGCGLLAVVGMYLVDITQTRHAVRHNFPVVGRFRYFFEHLGEFFRQYFFAQDRDEMPFNRAERSWVYRAAKGVDTTVAFGSSRRLEGAGTVLFANSPFPVLDAEAKAPDVVTIGPGCEKPYRTNALVNVSGMSFGAISRPAVSALSNGARKAGVWLNTGEGGVSDYHLEGGAHLVFQLGTAKYGVRKPDGSLDEDRFRAVTGHDNVKMVEIKLSQGAKPGKGGILPAEKVTREIARVRGIPVGEDSISPNRHPEIASADDLLDVIAHLRDLCGKPVGIKAVVGSARSIEELCERIAARGVDSAPDFITVDSADGGTGAAPMSLIDYVGLPIRESLPMVVDTLTRFSLRDRVRVVASGKLVTPAEAAWALCVGADFVTSARGFMLALGCIQALQCNKNTCPTGITTHDERLQRGLNPVNKAERVARYAQNIAREIEMIAHACGVAEPRQLGREHCRVVQEDGRSVSLDRLYPPQRPARAAVA